MALRKTSVKVGDVLGDKYRIRRVLGEGGVGIVFLAQHLELRQRVAIKVLQRADAPADVARFMREARSAVRLRGEHCVRVTDVGRSKEGAPFMVMEYLEGEDLSAVLERGPLPIPEAVDYILQACEGIAEAHAIGIVHRDLKPRNLFLARQVHGVARIKVVDFGLAKSFSTSEEETALTQTAAVMGSPQYMSPEQMRASRDVDKRTDIWSLGVCLYELLSAMTPFDGATVPELCVHVMTDEPFPIRRIRPDVPEELWEVLLHCLEKDPSRRYPTLVDLARALEPFASVRGAADRVAAVYYAMPAMPSDGPPPLLDAGTHSAAAIDTSRLSAGGLWIGLVAGAAAGILGIGLALVAFLPRGERVRPPSAGVESARGLAASTSAAAAAATSTDTSDEEPPVLAPLPPASGLVATDLMMGDDAPSDAGAKSRTKAVQTSEADRRSFPTGQTGQTQTGPTWSTGSPPPHKGDGGPSARF